MKFIMARADVNAPPARASKIILAPESLPKWFEGVQSVKAGANYPSVGSTISWTMSKGPGLRFEATVIENHLPTELKMAVKTPSAESVVTHLFEATSDNHCRYEKIVEPKWRGMSRAFAPLLRSIVQSSVRKEVTRAAALVDATPP